MLFKVETTQIWCNSGWHLTAMIKIWFKVKLNIANHMRQQCENIRESWQKAESCWKLWAEDFHSFVLLLRRYVVDYNWVAMIKSWAAQTGFPLFLVAPDWCSFGSFLISYQQVIPSFSRWGQSFSNLSYHSTNESKTYMHHSDDFHLQSTKKSQMNCQN